jgi:hypothetical protein
MTTSAEPRNPLYLLLLMAGLVFVVTAVACAVVPVMEQKALEAGNPPPPSEWRDALRADGWRWLLVEVAVLIVLGVASMAWDWRRSLQNELPCRTIADESQHPPGQGGGREHGREEICQ